MIEYWVNDNGIKRKMTQEEVAKMQSYQIQSEQSYDDLVNAEIRRRYSVSQEFAILRQKNEKPDEYAEYFKYCEQCKILVKAQQM